MQGPVTVVWYVLFCKFPEPLHLQGASSNFLVLRIKAHKPIRVSHAMWGPDSSGKEGLKGGFCPIAGSMVLTLFESYETLL